MNGVVALIGERAPGGLTWSIGRAMERLGVAVAAVPWPPPDISGLSQRVGLTAPTLLRASRGRLFQTVIASKPTAILTIKGQYLTRKFLLRLRSVSRARVVCWNPDSPLDSSISNRGGGLKSAIGAYDHYITWSETLASELRARGQPATRIPFGWDDELHFPQEASDSTLDGRPVFIGTWTESRARQLSKLRRLGLVVYGNGWPRSGDYEVRSPAYGADFAKVIGSAGCAINLLRLQNRDSHNMRTFEIPGCGGIQVAPWTPDHANWLESNTELYGPSGESLESVVERAMAGRFVGPRVPEWLGRHRYVDRVEKLLPILGITAG